MLKKDMVAQVREQGMKGRSYVHEVLVYRDRADFEENCMHHRAMNDFMSVTEAMKRPDLLQPGRVWDVFVYVKDFGERGELWENKVVEIGKENNA